MDEEIGWGFHLANQMSFMSPDDGAADSGGHVIHWVEKSGPAEYAGLRDGDRILEINDQNVKDMAYEDVMDLIHTITEEEMKVKIEYEDIEEESKEKFFQFTALQTRLVLNRKIYTVKI